MRPDDLKRLESAWRGSDALFALLPEEVMLERPIALRHPFLFYLGHLPAFAWNQIGRGVLGLGDLDPELDVLFERGIDPVSVDRVEASADGAWPAMGRIRAYRDRVREILPSLLPELAGRAANDPLARHGRIVSVAVEHELMHHETLVYMMQQLPLGTLRQPHAMPAYVTSGGRPGGTVEVAAGPVRLGADPEDGRFAWDNELPQHRVEVPSFIIDRTPVTNGDWVEFVAAGGYRMPELWRDDWVWRQRVRLEHPGTWRRHDGEWSVRTLFDELPLARVEVWPVLVSHAEASAFCRWRGRRLPSEPELERAAFTAPDGSERPFPWGGSAPEDVPGTWGFRHWAPTPVGTEPGTDSAWGVADLFGSAWEWTSTPFAGYPGFQPTIRTYPGYSADFFDGEHFVMRGASWATPTPLLRRSFRNWFQSRYPYVFATFRTVRFGASEGEERRTGGTRGRTGPASD